MIDVDTACADDIGAGAPDHEFEISPAMMDAGIAAYRLFDRGDNPEWIVWAIYQDMMEAASATGGAATKAPACQAEYPSASDRR